MNSNELPYGYIVVQLYNYDTDGNPTIRENKRVYGHLKRVSQGYRFILEESGKEIQISIKRFHPHQYELL